MLNIFWTKMRNSSHSEGGKSNYYEGSSINKEVAPGK